MSRRGAIAVAVLAAVACTVAGYSIGTGSAPTQADFDDELAEAREAALADARADAFDASHARGVESGRQAGQAEGSRQGTHDGGSAGSGAADEQVAASAPPLIQLPNGELGYSLPEEDRTLSCIGVEAATGECVGD